MPAIADTATKTFASSDNGKTGGSFGTDDVISWSAVPGTYTSYTPKVQKNDLSSTYTLRMNGNSTTSNNLIISSADGYLISNIEIKWYQFTFIGTTNYDGGSPWATADKGGVSVGNANVTTSGTTTSMSINNADKVTISVTDELRILTITVTYAKEEIVDPDPDVPGTDPEIGDLDPSGNTIYYIRNKATGLYIKYGGSWGMDAIEGRAAHPFKLTNNTNGSYALASIHGYFNSNYSFNSLFMDRPQSESTWSIVEVESGDEVYYYLRGENGYALASVGNQYGILEFRKHDTGDIFQRWEFVTIEETLPAEMAKASVTTPVDVTPFIKGAAFDFADHVEVQEGDPFYSEITGLTDENWTYQHSYANNWVGFKVMEQYDWMSRWSDVIGVSNTNLNGIGLSRNNIHDRYVVEQYLGELPAGTYTFTYQGFYNVRNIWGEINVEEIEKPTIAIAPAVGDVDPTNKAEVAFVNYTDNTINNLMDNGGGGDDRGYYVATLLRDNRDLCRNSIQFTLNETTHVLIRITKPETDETWGGSKLQWIIAFDDFTLMYQGTGNATVVDQAVLYYDRVKEAYEYYSKKVSELGESASYETCDLDGCVHWTAWDNAINGVVKVNGLNLRGNQYTVPSQKFAYLNGEADINKIDTEEEFLEALAKIEDAYQAAYAEHLSHATDITKETISNPSFELFDDEGNTIGWTVGWDGSVVAISGQTGEGLHGSKMYSTGKNGANTWTGRVSQVLTGITPGLYALEAALATDGTTAYLVANGFYSGVSSPNFNTFVDHEVLFLVEETQNVTIAVVGQNNPYPADYPLYGPHYFPGSGSSFRVDNFRLKRVADLPQGRVLLALADVEDIQIDKYAQEAALLDENSLQAYKLNTYTDDAEAKGAVTEIYSRFRNTVKAQRTKNADMTYAIADPSFEHGIDGAWTFSKFEEAGGDNGIYNNEGWIFTGSTGRKIFNTWQDDKASGPISQIITGIPNGTYKVTAVMASAKDGVVYPVVLTANGVQNTDATNFNGADNNIGRLISVETQVTDNRLEISAEAKDGKWYKVDNFHLTFLHNKLALDHADTDVSDVKSDWYTDVDLLRPMTNVTWNSFVVPYNMSVPENWDVRELTDGSINGTHLSMTFSRVSEIKAGIPYMVRYYPKGVPEDPALDVNTDSNTDNDDPGYENKSERVTYTTLDGKTSGTISSEYTDVDTSIEPTSGVKEVVCDDGTGTLQFVGSYVPTVIPEGAIFISDNKFYVSKGKSNIKGYRGYIVAGDAAAKARTFSMRTRGGESTDIESANNEEATVVGIYDINGVKLNEIQDGLNILRMSDGTTIKIMMK